MLTPAQQKQDCCGCMACSFACPRSAITMIADECDFLYPEINQELCVHCGLCTSVCPLQENYTGCDAVPDIYALQNQHKKIVSKSSSGGMFSLLADWVLAQRGVIYGVAFDESFQVRHMRAVSAEDAKPGDLVFFEKTYQTDGASHVGIYVGNGMMIHCGNPIQYTNINTTYWQQHFLGFGRLP